MKVTRTQRGILLALAAAMVVVVLVTSRLHAAAPTTAGGPYDACLYQQSMNQVPIAVATAAGPTLLIPGKKDQEIHVCQVPATVPSSSSYQFYQGPTGGVGLQPMTGALTSVPTSPEMTLYRASVGNSIYLTTTGTGMQGSINYVYEAAPAFQFATTTPFATSTATGTATATATATKTPTPTPSPT